MNAMIDPSQSYTEGTIEGRALALLGSGVPQEAVASALGVTPSYISQLLSNKDFAAQVTNLKFEMLSAHTARDQRYDTIEDSLMAKLEKSLPLMFKPTDILNGLKVINGAKRRGVDSTESIISQQNIVEITMPVQIVQTFTTNINNQVIKAGEQDLITIQSSDLLKTIDPDSLEEHDIPNTTPKIQSEPVPEPVPNPIESNSILDSL